MKFYVSVYENHEWSTLATDLTREEADKLKAKCLEQHIPVVIREMS